MILEYKKRENAKSPMRANPSDAGLDVFYCPADPNVSAARLAPGENQLFSTGLRFGVPHGYMLQVCNRSSMGAKRSLIVGAHIIDSGYDGEIFIDLHNIGKETQFVSTGDKIAQLILVPVVHFRALETKEENLYSEPITISNRGDGALGSTDKRAVPSTAQADMADRHGLRDIIRKGWLPSGF